MIISIMNHDWTVEKRKAHDSELYVDGVSCKGACWSDQCQIFLSDELKKETAARTVAHELSHAFLYATQAILPEDWTEEQLCEFVSIYAFDIVALTKKIVNTLYE